MTETAFVFPGQGSQKVGMGQEWAQRSAAARRTFEEADEALGEPLSKLIWEGPEEELGLTANTQPAILTCSIAVFRALEEEGRLPQPVAVAGHSLGEYTALVAAGALNFAAAVTLVRRRGELMQRAVPPGVGAMAAILAMDAADVAAVVDEVSAEAAASGEGNGEVVTVANYNANGQTVIAGHKAPVERACELAVERGARKATLLDVSAPFHSPLMAPAREGMAPLLAATELAAPRVPVVVNVDARPTSEPDRLRNALVRQIDGTVRWVESVEHLEREMGVGLFLEIGPGAVLTGMNKRIVDAAAFLAVGDFKDGEAKNLDKLEAALG